MARAQPARARRPCGRPDGARRGVGRLHGGAGNRLDWYFRGYKLAEIFNIYFTTALGIPPAWKVLALGLLAAAGAALTQMRGKGPVRVEAPVTAHATFAGGAVEL